MSNRLDQIISTFNRADDEIRLELLLDFSRKLPPLPKRYHDQRAAGLNQVPECMTPVFMWIEDEGDGVHIHVDVAEEAPTVKGFLSILIDAYDGEPTSALAEVPQDLINRLGLSNQIRMNRAIGIGSIIGRIRRQAAALSAARTPAHDG